MKLPDAAEMRGLDQSAIDEFHIPGIVLMENAGLGTVRMMEGNLGSPPPHSFALIFVGPGNNGGDGLVIGRHLHQRGCKPIFIFLVDPEKLQGDAAANMAIVRKLQLVCHVLDSKARVETLPELYMDSIGRGESCHVIVDAIFGTGLTRPVDGHYAEAIHFINFSESLHTIPVVAVDIPSGMDSDNGKMLGSCVHANYTATYGCAKPGHFLGCGPQFTGKLQVIDIGIPPEVVKKGGISTEGLDRGTILKLVAPLQRSENAHKGSHGHLAVLAGSIGKTGAAVLSVKGALRAGTGLVTLFSPEDLNMLYEPLLVEAMTLPLPESRAFLGISDLARIEQGLEGKKAALLGPGMGTAPGTAELVLSLYESLEIPLILDADALNILARESNSLPEAGGPRIYTPHPGEMARLLGSTVKEVEGNRLQAAREACSMYGKGRTDCIIVLKGTGTVITSSDGITYINTTGNPGMATGGMGDVLTGIIGGLLCQGLGCKEAAAAGVFLHGMAGDKLFNELGFGYTATELGNMLPHCISELLTSC